MATTPTASAGKVQVKTANPLRNNIGAIVIVASLIVGYALYYLVLGASANFEGGDTHNKHLNTLGLVYKGGILVGFAIALLLIVVTLTIERIITLSRASGKGSMDVFVQKVQLHLENNNIDAAYRECDAQRGTVGNVVKAALTKYREMSEESARDKQGAQVVGNTGGNIVVADVKDKEQKVLAIQKALEEATALELPVLNKNMIILATIVSIATLVGLIGTVLGMIKAFDALATAGAPDAVALAAGISEALINTALGITTSTIATVAYNYCTSQIDEMTYRIDEAGFSIVQTFTEKHA